MMSVFFVGVVCLSVLCVFAEDVGAFVCRWMPDTFVAPGLLTLYGIYCIYVWQQNGGGWVDLPGW